MVSKLYETVNGVVRFNKPAVQHHVYVDASLTGLGGVWGSRVYSTRVPTDVIGERAITQYEMYNILLAVCLWATDFTDRVICVQCNVMRVQSQSVTQARRVIHF